MVYFALVCYSGKTILAQSVSMHHLGSKSRKLETLRRPCVVYLSKTHILCLVLVQPRKTEKRPDKASTQSNKYPVKPV